MESQEVRGATRERLLTEIRTAATPPTVDELAAVLGLHRNSVRMHTQALQESGLVSQGTRPTGGRGRPLVVYRPTRRGSRAGGRNYELLAEVLVDHLAATEPQPASAARTAGRAWGGRLASRRRGAAGRVSAVLEEMGFEPDGDGPTIELRNCPFRELVDTHQGLVCSLHAGMLEGLVEADARASGDRVSSGDVGAAPVTLVPFSSPTSCTVRLGGDGAGGVRRSGHSTREDWPLDG